MSCQRPNSMAEIFFRTQNGIPFWVALKDFLHELNRKPNETYIQDEPPYFSSKVKDGDKLDAYLAASAVFLARRYNWAVPDWVYDPRRTLRTPWFILPGKRIRKLLIMESPAEFRERNIFVSINALDVV